MWNVQVRLGQRFIYERSCIIVAHFSLWITFALLFPYPVRCNSSEPIRASNLSSGLCLIATDESENEWPNKLHTTLHICELIHSVQQHLSGTKQKVGYRTFSQSIPQNRHLCDDTYNRDRLLKEDHEYVLKNTQPSHNLSLLSSDGLF